MTTYSQKMILAWTSKISCLGPLVADIEGSIVNLLDSQTGYVAGQSKIILDVSGDTSERYGISVNSDAGTFILTGTIINDATKEDDQVCVGSIFRRYTESQRGIPSDHYFSW